MNLEQLIKEINKDIDDRLDNEDIIGWVNRALDDIALIARIEAKATLDITSSIALPDDLLEIVHVIVNNDEYQRLSLLDKISRGYKVWGHELSLQNGPITGQLEMYYYKRLKHLSNGEDTPEIDPAFHDLLVLYTVAHSQYAEEEFERQADAMNRYIQRKREFQTFVLSHSNSNHQVTLVQEGRL